MHWGLNVARKTLWSFRPHGSELTIERGRQGGSNYDNKAVNCYDQGKCELQMGHIVIVE